MVITAGIAVAFFYGWVVDLSQFLYLKFSWPNMIRMMVISLPFDITHAVSNTLFAIFFSIPVGTAFIRVRERISGKRY